MHLQSRNVSHLIHLQGSIVTVLHSGNYKDDGHTSSPENVVINSMPDLGKAATYAGLITAGAPSADCILVTPPPSGGDNDSDAQVCPPPPYTQVTHINSLSPSIYLRHPVCDNDNAAAP